MSLESEIKRGGLDRGRYLYFPVVPGRVEFAVALRRLLLEQRPPIVALELPGFLETAYHRAITLLPEMSVILYTDENNEEGTLEYWITHRLELQVTAGDRNYDGVDMLWRRRY